MSLRMSVKKESETCREQGKRLQLIVFELYFETFSRTLVCLQYLRSVHYLITVSDPFMI